MIETLLVSLVAFVGTNLDDLVILSVLFMTNSYLTRNIVFGQLFGIGTLTLGSILIAVIAIQIIPAAVIGLLGVIPIIMGLRSLRDGGEDTEDSNSAIRGNQILAVMWVTIANGGDNIGIYVPLFASFSMTEIILAGITFMSMTLVWCYMSYQFAHHARGRLESETTKKMEKWVPYVLIALGVYVISTNDTLTWVITKTNQLIGGGWSHSSIVGLRKASSSRIGAFLLIF